MDTNILKYQAFIKTVECGSFTKAAELLHYSQSGISRMVLDLEREWDITLLERGRGGVRLTSDGMRMLPYAQSVCDEYEKLQMQLDDLHGVQSGIIRIGTFSSFATHRLPGIIKAFQKDYPGIDYELLLGDYSEIEEWIALGRVDCGFTHLPVPTGFDTIFIEKDRLLAIIPEGHPLSEPEKIPLEALCEEPFMLQEKSEKSEVRELFERYGVEPRIHFTTWDDYAVMSMVESGMGLSILPEMIMKRTPYRVTAKELTVPAYRSIVLTLRDRKSASIAVRRFLDHMIRIYGAGTEN